ncbi:MAG: BT4734/BF3469 family protein [Bacteroidia bacterium]
MENNLSAINCSIYTSIYSDNNSVKSISDILSGIEKGNIDNYDLRLLITEIRNEPDKEKRHLLKKKLPIVTFGGVFKDSRKSELMNCTGFLILDFDNLDEVDVLKVLIAQLKYTYACFVSPSANGLKVLVKAKINDAKSYKRAILKLFEYFKKELGIEADKSKQNINDACYLSYDNDLYINENSIEWEINEEEEACKLEDVTEVDNNHINDLINELEYSKIDLTNEYSDWLKIGFALCNAFGEKGRKYFHRISKLSSKYNYEEANKQYESCLKSNGEGITIATLFHIAKERGVIVSKKNKDSYYHFWSINEKGDYKLNYSLLFKFLENNGFKRFETDGGESIIIRVKEKILSKVKRTEILAFVMDFITNLDTQEEIKDRLKNTIYSNQNIFSEINLFTLNLFDGCIKRDTKDKSWLYFKNGIIEISKFGSEIISYDKLDGFIWESRVIKRNFNPISENEFKGSDFYLFLTDVCSNKDEMIFQQKLKSLCTIIGYLCHDYKDPANAKGIILMEEDDSDEPNGGKGKGILLKAISYVVKVTKEDGKSFTGRTEFPYSLIEHDTKVFFIDDAQDYLKFELFFSFITEGVGVNKKYKDKFFLSYENSPKLVISTNYTLSGEGESHERRKIEFELSDYYNIDNTPEMKFGKLLFVDWDETEWNKFYNVIIYSIQQYLFNGIVTCPSENLKIKRLKSLAGEEFIEFMDKKKYTLIDTKVNKANLFNEFYDLYERQKKIQSQRKFTTCLRAYSKLHNLEMIETKSGNDYSVMFKSISPN